MGLVEAPERLGSLEHRVHLVLVVLMDVQERQASKERREMLVNWAFQDLQGRRVHRDCPEYRAGLEKVDWRGFPARWGLLDLRGHPVPLATGSVQALTTWRARVWDCSMGFLG